MALPKFVKIVEVSPRDGLQNEKTIVPSDIKIEFINRLSDTGLSTIETTSFVSPKKIPQLADNSLVYQKINKFKNVSYPVLVPNLIGLKDAINSGVKEIAIFGSTSEAFLQHNINCSFDESMQRFYQVIEEAKQHALKIRAYISCALGCPYEGKIDKLRVAKLAKTFYDLGCYEVSLGDTIGIGTPNEVITLINECAALIPINAIAVHFHDTYGQAIANIYAALLQGVSVVDSSVAGLGGCPYAKGASGNVASEDVLYLLNGLGIETNVDLEKLIAAGKFITDYLHAPIHSKVALAKTQSNHT